MKKIRGRGGFTLIELAAVIAILSILFAVAVSGYSAYIRRACNASTEAFLTELRRNTEIANAQKGNVGDIEVTYIEKTKQLRVKILAGADGFSESFDDGIQIAYPDVEIVEPSHHVAPEHYIFTIDTPAGWAGSDYGQTGRAMFHHKKNIWSLQ